MMDTIIVLTARSVERMVDEGGSQAWRLVAARARQMRYIVCTRNAFATWGDGAEQHRSAFLVAKVRDVVPSPEQPQRWMVRFSEYARITRAEVWKKGDRNPVRYGAMDMLGIDVTKLKWVRMRDEKIQPYDAATTASVHPPNTKPLSITEAKHGLALAFNVPVEAIEITIRG